jgi:hypothetical protein
MFVDVYDFVCMYVFTYNVIKYGKVYPLLSYI